MESRRSCASMRSRHSHIHVQRSEAIQRLDYRNISGLPRRYAPCNDSLFGTFLVCAHATASACASRSTAITSISLYGLRLGALALGTMARLNPWRSEEHTSELQSLMRISYAVFCLKKKKKIKT